VRALFPWVPLGLLFLAPFVDPRRPFRLLHLDLLVLVGFGAIYLRSFDHPVGTAWFVAGAVMVGLGLVYLVARMLFDGFRERDRREPLVPYVPLGWLTIGLVLLTVFRASYALSDRYDIFNVGGAGVIGADLITHGEGIYGAGELATEVEHGDTYGPVNYLAYAPFELAFPLGDDWRDAEAARVAALGFDLLTLLGLVALGRRLRPGEEGRLLGVALGYAWVSYPYTLFTLARSFNDALVALLLVAALLAIASPAGRGALLALASATKFAPAALAPLFAAGVGPPRGRPALVFAAVFAIVFVFSFLPFIPGGGPGEIYDRTLGFQASREGCCGIIAKTTQLDGLLWLEVPAQITAIVLALLVAFRPRTKSFRQLAALGAAVIGAFQFAAPNWLPSYAVWLAPLILIALFQTDLDRASSRARSPGS
jgi:Glycosyltransferase family 87